MLSACWASASSRRRWSQVRETWDGRGWGTGPCLEADVLAGACCLGRAPAHPPQAGLNASLGLTFTATPPGLHCPAEYCARGSLTDVLREAACDPEKAARLTWQVSGWAICGSSSCCLAVPSPQAKHASSALGLQRLVCLLPVAPHCLTRLLCSRVFFAAATAPHGAGCRQRWALLLAAQKLHGTVTGRNISSVALLEPAAGWAPALLSCRLHSCCPDQLARPSLQTQPAGHAYCCTSLHRSLPHPAGMLALHSHSPVVLHRDLKGWVLRGPGWGACAGCTYIWTAHPAPGCHHQLMLGP